ncbi:hypothetical protein EK21DRAFT_66921, partial [Setomelanomma holmii]
NSQNPQQKRKDQIRRAQKTHRERKEAYIKSLELEVVQLRANEARILQETRKLYGQIGKLERLLDKHNIQDRSNGQYKGLHRIGRMVAVIIRELRPTSLIVRHLEAQRFADADIPSALPASQSASTTPTSSPFMSTSITKRVSDLDLMVVGMDFVLSLESPCFSHMFPYSTTATTGHALCVSSTLLHHHPSPSPSPSEPATWQVPALSIERLLELSRSIPLLEGEMTPVQAWDVVQKHPEFAELEIERLEGLKERLLKGVKCYGYGGVVDQVTFEDAVFETFVVGRVF